MKKESEILRDSKSEELYTKLVNNSPVGIYIAQNNAFHYVNPRFQEITGYTAEELLKMPPITLVHPEDRDSVRTNALAMVKGVKSQQNQFRINTKNGQEKWAMESIIPITHNGIRASLGNFMDITDRKKTEIELRKALTASETSMAEVTALLEASQTVCGHPRFKDAAGDIFNILKRITGATGGYVALVVENDEKYQIAHIDTQGEECHLDSNITMMIKGLSKESYKSGKSIFNNDLKNSPWAQYMPEKHLAIENILFTPLTIEDNPGGLLALINKPGGFTGGDVQLVEGMTNFLNIALSNSLAWDSMGKSENRYRDLYNQAPIAFFSISADGLIQTANNKAGDLLYYKVDELIGKPILDVYANTNLGRERARAMFLRANMGKSIRDEELEMLTRDGEYVWVSLSVEPVTDDDGKVIAHRLAAIDITERKQAEIALEESQARFMEMADLLPQGVWEINRAGKFTFFNKEALRSHGYTNQEISKLTNLDLFEPGERNRIRGNLEYVFAGGDTTIAQEYVALRKDGTTFPVMIYAAPIVKEGKVTGLRGITIDITERKKMEAELGEKVAELVAANERLKELDKLKDGFLSTVSHELRTPLTSIKSFAEILLAYEEDRNTQKEFLGIINEEAGRLTRLINDFLDLSKIQAGRMQWTTTDVSLPWVIQTAVNANHSLISNTHLDLNLTIEPDLPIVRGDKDRLVQVMTNLLGNAIKFTPVNGKVGIAASALKGDETTGQRDMVIISVKDSGIGIATEHHQTIFEKFSQVGDTLKDRPKGTGLGLPISKEIIEHFGGKIWVESEFGKGATFYFSLPVAGAPAAQPGPAVNEITPPSVFETSPIILVVDDEANIRKSIGHELVKRGYQVIEAATGKEAIDLARKYHPRLITLDVVMPDIDGFDVTSVLKNDPGTKDIPILIVSVIEDQAKAFRLGINGYITKPFVIDNLLEKITQLVHDKPKTILVVDDDKSLVKSLEYELRKRGYSTRNAYNGKEALREVAQIHPGLIMLDINMPEMDGYEVIKFLKSHEETRHIPVLVMTGLEIDGGRVKALTAGATEYFNKSGELSRLYDAVDGILQHKPG